MDKINRDFRAALPLMLITGMLVGQTNVALAHNPGKPGDDRATAGCGGSCHAGSTVATTVAFGLSPSGSVPASVVAGSTHTFTFTVSGGPAVRAGLSVLASAGSLAVSTTATDAKVLSGEVVHIAPAAMSAGSVTYTFTWTAPVVTTTTAVTLTGAGVSSDGANDTGGDSVDKKTVSIDVTPAVGTTPNVPPIAFFTGNTTGTVGVQVAFDSAGSTDPDGTIAVRNWNFGDNGAGVNASSTNTVTDTTHTYATAGTFPVTLTVTDSAGATTSISHNIVVAALGAHPAPVAKAGGPYTGTAGTALAFTGSTSTVDGILTATYSWDFGHGGALATGATSSHTYPTAGTYLVTLTVTDSGTPPLSSAVTTRAEITTATTPSVTPTPTSTPTPGPTPLPTPPPSGSSGKTLYNAYCASCHGPGGNGGDAKAVIGASKSDITEAIETEPEMASLRFLLAQKDTIKAIATFLDQEEEDDLSARAAKNNSAAAGALDWLTLLGVGAWGLRRRRKR